MKFQFKFFLPIILLAGCTHTSDLARKERNYVSAKYNSEELSCTDSTFELTTQLYFGLSKPAGGNVTLSEWNRFLAGTLIPAFGGMTIFSGEGAWENYQGLVETENNKVIVWLHENSDENNRKIRSVTTKYINEFNQHSVLVNSFPTQSSFCRVENNN